MNTQRSTSVGSIEALDPLDAEPLVTSPKRLPIPEFGLVVSESRHAPGFYGRFRENHSAFCLIIAGRAVWKHGSHCFQVGPDMLFHTPSGLLISQKDLPHRQVTLYFIHYRPELLPKPLRDSLNGLGMLGVDLSSPSVNQTSSIRSLYREMLFEQDAKRPGWQMLLLSSLLSLAVRSIRMAEPDASVGSPSFQPGSDSAERVAQYALRLRSRFYNQPTLDAAAKSVSLSERRFTDLFRRATGKTWCQYLQSLRLDYARKLLVTTEKSITAVAFESGFQDLSHFHHVFKTVFGCSPLKFRRQPGSRG